MLVLSASVTGFGICNACYGVCCVDYPPPLLNQICYLKHVALLNLLRSGPTWSTNIMRYFTPFKANESALISEDQQCIPHSLLRYVDQLAIGQGWVLNVLCSDYCTLDSSGLREYINL